MMYDYYGYGNNFYPMHSGLGPVFMIITWAFIIWGIISLVKYFSGHSRCEHNKDHDKSINILKERYAKGEITKEEFESIKKDLQ